MSGFGVFTLEMKESSVHRRANAIKSFSSQRVPVANTPIHEAGRFDGREFAAMTMKANSPADDPNLNGGGGDAVASEHKDLFRL
jgi:hypothetical protein